MPVKKGAKASAASGNAKAKANPKKLREPDDAGSQSAPVGASAVVDQSADLAAASSTSAQQGPPDAAASQTQQLAVAAPSEASPNAAYYAALREQLNDLEQNCPEFNGTQVFI